MQRFQNILFISHGIAVETEALKQALSLARNNKAALRALVVYPEFPAAMLEYKSRYEDSLKEGLQQAIQTARDALKLGSSDVPVGIEVEAGATPAMRIIRHVLRNAHDLLVKEAEPREGRSGFKALDMELLRKCPCPVFLCRSIANHRNDIRVAVAIDPMSDDRPARDLSLKLLQVARELADTCSGELRIVSCWLYEYENTLRGNPRFNVTEENLQKTVMETQAGHKAALEALIRESGIGGMQHVLHIKGLPERMIPSTIEGEKVDILVMGSVARTGLRAFIIGNTAENVVQNLQCSLLALKPNGFVSPVHAY